MEIDEPISWPVDREHSSVISGVSLEDLLKRSLKSRKDVWPTTAQLPNVHLDFTSEKHVTVVFDGNAIEVPASRIELGNLAQSFGQAFFERFCVDLGKGMRYGSAGPSYEDAKRMAEKVARKAERLPQMQTWLVHAR